MTLAGVAERAGVARTSVEAVLAGHRGADVGTLLASEPFGNSGGLVIDDDLCKGKNKPESQKQANRAHAKLRGPGERANAQLKCWRIFRMATLLPPQRAGKLAKAVHVLIIQEAKA